VLIPGQSIAAEPGRFRSGSAKTSQVGHHTVCVLKYKRVCDGLTSFSIHPILLLDPEDEDRVPTAQEDARKRSSLPPLLSHPSLSSLQGKKKKRGKVDSPKVEVKRPKREKMEVKKPRRKPVSKAPPTTQSSRTSNIQSLLNAGLCVQTYAVWCSSVVKVFTFVPCSLSA